MGNTHRNLLRDVTETPRFHGNSGMSSDSIKYVKFVNAELISAYVIGGVSLTRSLCTNIYLFNTFKRSGGVHTQNISD